MKRALGPVAVACALLCAAAVALASGGGKIGLAYANGGNPQKIVIANANGSDARTLTDGSVPAVSPNGASVAFGPVTGRVGLVVYSAAGKLTGKFFVADGVEVNPIAWSHDSRYIAVALTDVNATTKIGKSGVAIIDTTTGKATTVAHGQVQGVSWSPSADTVAFGLVKSANQQGPSNLYEYTPATSSTRLLTKGNNSVEPVWGKLGIAFDRFKNRKNYAPLDEIWLLGSSGHLTQITHTKPNRLVDGLVPIAVSANGQRMIAGFEGTDTDNAYTVNLATHAVRELHVGTQVVTPWGISRNGQRLLVNVGGFESSNGPGNVETLSFAGGDAKVLGKGDLPSWDQ